MRVTAFYDPDEARAKVERDIALAQERAERAAETQQQIAAVRGTGRSPRKEVTVVVDASGQLRDLELTDEAVEYRARDLAEMILDAARAAQRDAGARALALAEDAWGAEDPAVAHLRAEVEQRYA